MQPIQVVNDRRLPGRAYAIVLILLVAGPVLFYEWLRHWPRVQPGQPATEPNSWIAANSDSRMQAAAAFKPIFDVQVISDATDPKTLFNLPVELQQAGVRSVPDGGGFWVSQVRTPMIFVAFGPSAKRTPVKWRQSVEVVGHVRQLPARDEIRKRWPGVRGDDLRRLEKQGVYIEADEVNVNGPYSGE